MTKRVLASSLVALLTVTASALAAAHPSGTYKANIPSMGGAWDITFSHGSYTVRTHGQTQVKGKNTFHGNEITFHDKSGPGACQPAGTWHYKLSGKTLKFTDVSDHSSACTGRQNVLRGKFTKVG